MSSLKLLGTLVLAYTCVVAAPAQAQAQQGYPNRPIRFVVPYPPGGLPDVIARVLGQRLSDSLGTPIVVENKPGAMGRVAAGALTSAPADGYTFLVTDSSMLTIGPLLSRAAAADVSEIEPVTMVGDAPLYLLVHPDVPAKTLEEFVSYARTRTQRVNYGSSGNGTVHHLVDCNVDIRSII
jgi:tripartite-type tricarboxylate transporter receptor subunit TctC